MTEYPQRKEHRHPDNDRANLRLRNLLNTIFIVLVIIAIVCYFVFSGQRLIFTILSFIAVLVKGVEVSIRILANKNKGNDKRRNHQA